MQPGFTRVSQLSVVVIAIVLFFFTVGKVSAQAPDIVEIRIQGNNLVERDSIVYYIESQVGRPLNPQVVRQDIKRLYELGSFDDVQVKYEPTPEGVILIYIVHEKPMITGIKFSGDDRNKSELEKLLSVKPRTILNMALVNKDLNQISRFFSEKGYYLVEVSYELEKSGENQVVLTYNIDKNEKVKVKRIHFIGNDNFTAEELKKSLLQKEKRMFRSGDFKEEQLEIDQQLITNFYFDRGYITAVVQRPNIYLSPDKKVVYVTYIIEEGEQYRLGELHVKGELLNTESFYINQFALKKGDIFNRSIFVNEVDRLTNRYMDLGYAYATVMPQTRLNEELLTVDVNLYVTRGKLTYIDRIVISGNTKTRDNVIRREMPLAEGDLFSNSALKVAKQDLNYLSFFEKVEVTRNDRLDQSQIGISLNVEEKQTGALSFGAGYSSLDKFFGMGQISQINLFGRGQRLRFSAQVSQDAQNFDLGFTEPRVRDTHLLLGFDLYNQQRSYVDEYTKKVVGGAIRARYPLWRRLYCSLRYRLDETTVSDVEEGVSPIIADQEGTSITSAVKGGLEWDTRNNYIAPTSGNHQAITVEYAGGFLGGDNYYVEYIGNSVWYIPLIFKTVFMAHGEIGYIQPHGGRDIPIYMLYRLGGLYSVRGFESYSLGPKDPETDDVIGGNKELFFNFEFLFPLIEPAGLKGVLFFDAGNAFGENQSYDINELRTGAGFGVRWFSPLGPLRFEWGYNLDPEEGESPSQFEFSIGTFF